MECRFIQEPDSDLLATMTPEDWESSEKVFDFVLDKWSRRYIFHYPEPGISFTYSNWKVRRNTGRAIMPKYDNFSPDCVLPEDLDHQYYSISLQERFRTEDLQIIVQVTSIDLTPDHPTYSGDREFYVAGMLNEHIVATAVYYYDVQNIDSAKISFEQEAVIDNESFNVDNEDFINNVWDIPDCDVPKGDEFWQFHRHCRLWVLLRSRRVNSWHGRILYGPKLNHSNWMILLVQDTYVLSLFGWWTPIIAFVPHGTFLHNEVTGLQLPRPQLRLERDNS